MASLFTLSSLVTLALLSSLLVQGTLGRIICEQLNKEECALAASSIGKRCVLEKYVRRSGMEAYKCTTSTIEADKLKDLVETNHCIEACGLDRDTLGISSDSLLESLFTQKLCSKQCYQNCPNVIDLYFNLAASEGVFLPKLCATQGENPRRGMSEIKSSGIAAPGPVSGVDAANFLVGAPIEAPMALELGAAAPAWSPMSASAPATAPAWSPISASAPATAPAWSPISASAPATAPAWSPISASAPATAPAWSPISASAPATAPAWSPLSASAPATAPAWSPSTSIELDPPAPAPTMPLF